MSVGETDGVLSDFYTALSALTKPQRHALAPFGITRHLLWQWRDRRRLPTIEQASAFAAVVGMNAHALFDALALARGQIRLERQKRKGQQGTLFAVILSVLAAGLSPGSGCVDAECRARVAEYGFQGDASDRW